MTAGSLALLALILLPAVAGVVLPLLRLAEGRARAAALGVSLVQLALLIGVWAAYQPAGPRLQLESSMPWIPAFGADLAIGVDGIALVMIALIVVLMPIVIAASSIERFPDGASLPAYYALLLILEACMIGVFAATDVFLFYVLFEVMLVPMYFLIGRFGAERRVYAAAKFFLYSFLGGLIMLASVIGLFVRSGEELGQGTLDWQRLVDIAGQAPLSSQIWLFLGFFIAFAIKAPLVPLHTWLPDAGTHAPIGVGLLLVGVMDKVGVYGLLRYNLALFPDASTYLAPLVLVLSVIGIIYVGIIAARQDDMKRFVAYTSVAHFGFIGVGIFAFTSQAQSGAVLYMINHGISTGMLFLVVGMVIARGGSRFASDYGGLRLAAPLLSGAFLIAGLSSLALPGTNSFVSEFLVLIGSFPTRPVFAILATVGTVLAALYVLWMYQRVTQGPLRGSVLLQREPEGPAAPAMGGPGAARNPGTAAAETIRDVGKLEIALLAPLVVLIIVLGIYPKPVLNVITPSVTATMEEVGMTDPVTQQGGN